MATYRNISKRIMHAGVQAVLVPGTDAYGPPRYELMPLNEWWDAGEVRELTESQAALLLTERRIERVETP